MLELDQIINAGVLKISNPEYPQEPATVSDEEEEPPIIEPKALKLGDVSGHELIYTQKSGELAVIYFDPTTVEQVGNFINLSPMGIDERYAIANKKIVNREVLEELPGTTEEELPPVLPVETEPIPPKPQTPTGAHIFIRSAPTDSYEALQLIRRIKPKLSTFEIFELLDPEHQTPLTGFHQDEAVNVGIELEAADCKVEIKYGQN